MPTNKREPDLPADSEQSEAFIKKARELGADHESDADTLMGRMAKMKPEPRQKKTPADEKSQPGHSKSGERSPD